MNFSPDSTVTVNEVLVDILKEVGDEDNLLFERGYYISLVKDALDKFSFESYFKKQWQDFDMPTESLSLKMPEGAFNIKTVFVFSGDCCSVDEMRQVHYKRGYATKGADYGYTARNKNGADDYFISYYSNSENILFYNLQNGYVLFGSACAEYEKVRLYYNGVQTKIGDLPIIPLPIKRAVTLYVVEETFRKLKTRDPRKYRALWNDIYNILYTPITGIWEQAIRLMSSSDSGIIEDFSEYMSKMNY